MSNIKDFLKRRGFFIAGALVVGVSSFVALYSLVQGVRTFDFQSVFPDVGLDFSGNNNDKAELEGYGFNEEQAALLTEYGYIKRTDGDVLYLDIGSDKKDDIDGTPVKMIGVTFTGKEDEKYKERFHIGDMMYLEYDAVKEKDGKIQAYVYFDDMKMAEEWLINNDYAEVSFDEDNIKYKEQFKEIQE
jgi:hypothetical protein